MKSQLNVFLPNSNRNQKLLLESAKIINLQLLDLDTFKNLKELKKTRIERLRRITAEIETLADSIRLKQFKNYKMEGPKKPIPVKKIIQKEIKVNEKESSLLAELEEIERKLSTL